MKFDDTQKVNSDDLKYIKVIDDSSDHINWSAHSNGKANQILGIFQR